MGQICCTADDRSPAVEAVTEPAAGDGHIDKCLGKEDSDAENMDSGDSSRPRMYKKLAAQTFMGVDFPVEHQDTNESFNRMAEISERLRKKHGVAVFGSQPTFKHLKIQANVAGAPKAFLVSGINVTRKGASIAKDASRVASNTAKDASRVASNAVRIVSGVGFSATDALRDRLKGAKPMEIKSGRKLPGNSPGNKQTTEWDNEEAAEEEANLEPEENDTHGHGAEALSEVAGKQADGTEAAEAEGTEGVEIPNIIGIWKCIDTWGLEAFLKSCGVGFVQRKAAMGAPWPWWAFDIEDDLKVHFVNHGPLGEVVEHIDTSGRTYISLDAKKQQMSNSAQWEGDSLIIDRSGPQGEFQERRTLDADDKLQFSLELMSGEHKGQKWGRVFQRGDVG